MDIRRLGAGIDNLITDIGELFAGPLDPPGTRSDVINEKGISNIDGDFNRDLIHLYFDDITNGKRIQFRATVANINESHTPEWTQHSYIGRPYPIHQYIGVSRTLTFDFKVYAMNKNEMGPIWEKLNYLTGMTHPASYVGSNISDGFMTPPYVELTLGAMFRKIPGYINSLNYTIQDGISWDINKELPLGVDINISFTIIETESHSNQKESQFYGKPSQSKGNFLTGLNDAWKDLISGD